jgi:hypothetical protein
VTAKVGLAEALARFSKYFDPRIVGELNGEYVRLVKSQGNSSGTTTSVRTKCFSSFPENSTCSSGIER